MVTCLLIVSPHSSSNMGSLETSLGWHELREYNSSQKPWMQRGQSKMTEAFQF